MNQLQPFCRLILLYCQLKFKILLILCQVQISSLLSDLQTDNLPPHVGLVLC